MISENNKLFGKQCWKTSVWKYFLSQKHIEKDFSTYPAKNLIKSLEELKYHTRKHLTSTEQSQTRNYFLRKSFFLKFSSK